MSIEFKIILQHTVGKVDSEAIRIVSPSLVTLEASAMALTV